MKMGESPREMDKKPSVNNNQITQNVKDLLSSREVENIFENSDFVYMLNQAGGDRQILAKQLGISTHQLSYVTHSGEGEGLLFYGSTILPFVDHFPKNTELYRIMTTKPQELKKKEDESSGISCPALTYFMDEIFLRPRILSPFSTST